ncbi:MAG: glucosamine-6-phosphate deaminase, partial [Pseudomonadota bacterium]
MEVLVRPDRKAAVALTASLIEAQIARKPDSVLGLATGRTMEAVYDRLARQPSAFRDITTFNLDEYVGLPASDPRSYAHYMRVHLFDRVEIDPANAHLPDGMADDLIVEAESYERRIADAGGIDLQLLGIGETGHIGFNEPSSSLRSRTRDKLLAPGTRAQNAAFFGGDPDAVPARALTMGVGTILDARTLVLLACGADKAEIVAAAVEGPVTASVSASAIQFHNACVVVLD